MTDLLLKRTGPIDDQYKVLAEVHEAAPRATPALDLAYGEHEKRTPTHSYEPTREAAMQNERRNE